MWIDTGGSLLPKEFEERLVDAGVVREDRTDHVWVNLDTGSVIVLACNGGWRTAHKSRFQVFLSAPGHSGPLVPLTFAVLGESSVPFDTTQTAVDTYRNVRATAVEQVTAFLGAKRAWEPTLTAS